MRFRTNPRSFWGKEKPPSKDLIESLNRRIQWISEQGVDDIELIHFLGSGYQSDAYRGSDGFVYYLSPELNSLSKGILSNFIKENGTQPYLPNIIYLGKLTTHSHIDIFRAPLYTLKQKSEVDDKTRDLINFIYYQTSPPNTTILRLVEILGDIKVGKVADSRFGEEYIVTLESIEILYTLANLWLYALDYQHTDEDFDVNLDISWDNIGFTKDDKLVIFDPIAAFYKDE